MLKDLSYREKSLWASLLAVVGIGGYYFFEVVRDASAGVHVTGGELMGRGIGTIVLLVIVQVAFQVALALLTREDPPDERDRLIEARAVLAAYSLLTVGAYTAICHVLVNGKFYPLVNNAWFGPYMTVHVIFLFAIASEALKMAMQLYYYRRGVA